MKVGPQWLFHCSGGYSRDCQRGDPSSIPYDKCCGQSGIVFLLNDIGA